TGGFAVLRFHLIAYPNTGKTEIAPKNFQVHEGDGVAAKGIDPGFQLKVVIVVAVFPFNGEGFQVVRALTAFHFHVIADSEGIDVVHPVTAAVIIVVVINQGVGGELHANATDNQHFIAEVVLFDLAIQPGISLTAFDFISQQYAVSVVALHFYEHAILQATGADVVKVGVTINLHQYAIAAEGAGGAVVIVNITGDFDIVVVVEQVIFVINFLGEQDITVYVELTFHLNREPVLQLVQPEIVIRDRAGV